MASSASDAEVGVTRTTSARAKRDSETNLNTNYYDLTKKQSFANKYDWNFV
jgi:hypothetical protein